MYVCICTHVDQRPYLFVYFITFILFIKLIWCPSYLEVAHLGSLQPINLNKDLLTNLCEENKRKTI